MANEYAGKVVVVSGEAAASAAASPRHSRPRARTVLAASSAAEPRRRGRRDCARSAALRPEVCAADLRREDGCEQVFRFVADRTAAATFW